MNVITAAETREMDRRTIEEYGVPSIILMENAALRVVDILASRYSPLMGKRIVVVCGKGNNGGDGLTVARHLMARFSSRITVWLAADALQMSGDAAASFKMAQSFGIDIKLVGLATTSAFVSDLNAADLIVDALLGTGVTGPLKDPLGSIVDAMNRAAAPVISVDIPSGVNADTGQVDAHAVRADLTITFVLPKIGLFLYPGAGYIGELHVVDIGMPPDVMAAKTVTTRVTDSADVAALLPTRENGRDTNKGRFGHVTLFAGSAGFIGAAALCSEAAARTGAGLVTLAVPNGLWNAAMSSANPVVMTKGLAETRGQTFSAAGLEEALALAKRGAAAGLGSGIGGSNDPDTQTFVETFIANCEVPLVIDADALNILSLTPDRGASVVRSRSAGTVLTPHPGELGRLLGVETASIQEDRLGAVRRAEREYGCTVLLKGARTLIASQNLLSINTTGNAGMATGGAGDVLTGVVTALLGQNLSPHNAALAGAYIHGLAGDVSVVALGGRAGLIAQDLCDHIPEAIGNIAGSS